MKRAFTLIELVIVLVIIGILMGVTMQFGANRIGDLQSQVLKEKFLDSYSTVYSQNMASSYHLQQHYQSLYIHIGSGVSYDYDSGAALLLFWDATAMSISGLMLDTTAKSEVTLTFTPYHLGCAVDAGSGIVNFQLIVKPSKTYCFSISPDTCSLREKVCE